MGIVSPVLPEELLAGRHLVLLPVASMDEAVAPVEVLVQEGLRHLSLPACAAEQMAGLRQIFGARARFYVHDLRSAEQAEPVVAAGIPACLTLTHDAQVLAGLADAGIAYCTPALTPTEIERAWDGDHPAAVQVVPAGVMNTGYPAQLAALVPHIPLIARGAEAAFEVRGWLKAGAKLCCLGEKILGDAFAGGDLNALRRRCHQIVQEFSLASS